MDSNMLSLEETQFDVAELVEDTAALFSSVAEASSARLFSFIDTVSLKGLNIVVGDPHRLQQILQNLIGNAIKFCSPTSRRGSIGSKGERDREVISGNDFKGEVLIILDTIPWKDYNMVKDNRVSKDILFSGIALTAKNKTGSKYNCRYIVGHNNSESSNIPNNSEEVFFRFTVTDNGIGISESGLRKLFLPFSQCDSSTTRKYGGTGLGLVICKQLCELMGGDIYVKSKEGEGTSITFLLPLKRPQSNLHSCEDASKFKDNTGDGKDEHTNVEMQDDMDLINWEKFSLGLKNKKIGILCNYPRTCEIVNKYLVSDGLNLEILEFEDYLKIGDKEDNKPKYDLIISEFDLFKSSSFHENSESITDMLNLDLLSFGATNFVLLALWKFKRIGKVLEVKLPGNKKKVRVGFCAQDPIKRANLCRTILACTQKLSKSERLLQASCSPSPPTEREIPRRHLNILLCEDNIVNIEVILRQLKKLDYVADVAENGVEALKAFKKKKYDVILMDCQMPVLDGYGATSAIRKLESENSAEYPEPVLIIALTASAMPEEREKGLNAGMNLYLSKPIQLSVLQGILSGI